MLRSALLRSRHLLLVSLFLTTACTAASDSATAVDQATADTANSGADAGDTTASDSAEDTSNDTSTEDTASTDTGNVGGAGIGEACGENGDCASNLCFFLDDGAVGYCSNYCLDASNCGGGDFDCVLLANSGGDVARVCVPSTLCLDPDGDTYGIGPACAGADCDETSADIHPGNDELCDAIDNDCDGLTDENTLGEGENCDTGLLGICGAGRRYCEGGVPLCVPAQTAGEEFCDSLDNDCDGLIDNGTAVEGLPCSTGLPGVCAIGGSRCEAGRVACEATTAVGERTELCDGLDNDCDNDVDELFSGVGGSCYTGIGACRRAGVAICNPLDRTAAPLCNAIAADPAASESCNYEDDDCDGTVDEDFKAGDEYAADTACGNCFTDCTTILDRPNAYGLCSLATGDRTCEMFCDPGFFDLNANTIDGCEFELDAQAVYVSQTDSLAADAVGCGLGPSATERGRFPCLSIGYGIGRAATLGRSKVRVEDGAYEETVTLVDGISLYGGHRAGTWNFQPFTTGTAIRGVAAEGDAKTLIATNIVQPTTVRGFLLYGQSPTTSAANAYVVYIRDSGPSLIITDNRIFGGNAADADNGSSGQNGAAGVSGAVGRVSYSVTGCSPRGSAVQAGGTGGGLSCQDPATFSAAVPDTFTAVSGGNGGGSICPTVNQQEGTGASGANGGGAGGAGGWGHTYDLTGSCVPTVGQPEMGSQGANASAANNGDGGLACSVSRGSIVDGEWRAGTGAQGLHGNHGKGGGGGGSGSGQKLSGYTNSDISGSGGGGGSGGCGAEGGYAGSGGGGSFGIFLYWTAGETAGLPQIFGNTLARGRAGDGGTGGAGGAGGDGGAAGAGGGIGAHDGPLFCIFGGASGGNGSRGGHGGGGGGGCGGNSVDIFAWGTAAGTDVYADVNTFLLSETTVTAGSGGDGGNSINTATGAGGDGARGRTNKVLFLR